ncbi:MAG: ribosome assembly RNA-binding protein YhbY [Lachnospiraceae bacterium]|nr:ribosome assembly RNA-binding protein YhbY [Lachnospiraceae bacterium]
MTSKERAALRGLAMKLKPILNIGNQGLTEGALDAVREALEANELLKINVLKNCMEEPYDLADQLSEGTRSEVVSVIGRKIVLFKPADKPENRKIVLKDLLKAQKSAK